MRKEILKRWGGRLLVLLVPAVLSAGTTSAADQIRLSFDEDAPGTPPAYLRFESSGGLSTGGWRVEPSDNPVTTPNVAVQTDSAGAAGQYRFALSTEAKSFRNGSVRASLRCGKAGSPCRSGVALRYAGPGDFVAAVYDFSKSTVTLFAMRKGKSETLGSTRFESLERFWTTVSVDAKGKDLAVQVSGRDVLKAKDPHPRAGEAGLIAEGGGIESFDELVLAPR